MNYCVSLRFRWLSSSGRPLDDSLLKSSTGTVSGVFSGISRADGCRRDSKCLSNSSEVIWPSIALLTDEVLLAEALDDWEHVVMEVVATEDNSLLIKGVNIEDVIIGVEVVAQELTCVAIDRDFDGFPVELLLERLALDWLFVFFFLEVLAIVCDSLEILSVIFFFFVSNFLDSMSESLERVSSVSVVDDSIFSYCKSRSKRYDLSRLIWSNCRSAFLNSSP